jgi:ABC-type branched-subunit amino acid transport system ATPase component
MAVNVDHFELLRGSIAALIGPNGAGFPLRRRS